MKTLIAPLIIIASIATLAGNPTRLAAQEMMAQASAATQPERLRAEPATTCAAQPSRIDFVDARFAPVQYNGDAFLRTTTPLCNGSFSARVVDANGTLRMTGSYTDAELSIPNGSFIYFYENGSTESSGSFKNGTKSGTWERYASDGRRLADREYRGLDVDGLLELNGLIAFARTLN